MSRITVLIILAALLGASIWLVLNPDNADVGSAGTAAGTDPASSEIAVSQPGVDAQSGRRHQKNSEEFPPELAQNAPNTATVKPDEECQEAAPNGLAELINNAEIAARVEEYEARTKGSSKKLSDSTEAEHLLVAAMQEDDGETRLQLITRALDASPDTAVTLWTAAHICAGQQEHRACPLNDWLERLVQVDSQNSESWMLAATRRYLAGDLDAALYALRQAASAPETNIFWADVVELTERSLSAAGDYNFAERVHIAFGVAASGGPHYMHYINMCKEQSEVNSEWASLCFAYGERAELQSKTALGASIARAVQSTALRTLGDNEKLLAVNARRDAYRKKRLEYKDNSTGAVMTSPALFYTYLDAVKRFGEDQAQKIVAAEARRIFSEQRAAGCGDG